MKRITTIVVTAALAAGMVIPLTACGQQEAETNQAEDISVTTSAEAEQKEPEYVHLSKTYSTADIMNIIGYTPLRYVKLPKNYKSLEVEYSSTEAVEGDPKKLAVEKKLERSCKYKIPYSLVNRETEKQINLSKQYAKANKMTWKEYVSSFKCKNDEEFREYTMNSVRDSLKADLSKEAVIQAEKITVSDEDFVSWQGDASAEAGEKPKELVTTTGYQQAILSCAMEKAVSLVTANADAYDTAEIEDGE